jgi:hypothetical protein
MFVSFWAQFHGGGNLKSAIKEDYSMRKSLFRVFAIILVLAFAGAAANAQSVLFRKRLGNNSEDITAIHSGPLAGTIAIMDGTDVLALSNEDDDAEAPQPPRTLFSVLGLGVLSGPRGIAFLDPQQQFLFDDPAQINTLFLSDIHGVAQGTINVTRMGGFTPDHVEGLEYLPSTSANFPNHILQVAITFGAASTQSRLEVIDPSGQVGAEIFPQIPFADPFTFISGLGFQAPNRLLVGGTDGTLWQIDFAGNLLAGPIRFPGVEDLEGIVQINPNRIAVAGYDVGKIMFVDENLSPLAGQDRNYLVGFGLSQPLGVTWDTDTTSHLVNFPGSAAPANAAQIISMPPLAGSETRVVDLTGVVGPTALTYLPDEHRIAVSRVGCAPNCSILLYDNGGNLVDQVPVRFNLRALSYIPTTKQFAARRAAAPQTLLFFDRTGALVKSIDLSASGIDGINGIAFFNPSDPSGGELLISSTRLTHQMFVFDLHGAVHAQFDYRTSLGVIDARDLAAITIGQQTVAFSTVDPEKSEIVIFRLAGTEEED